MILRRLVMTSTILTGLSMGASSEAAAQAAVQFFAVLSGGNEVPAGAGAPNGSGVASLLLLGRSTVCYSVLVSGIDTPTEFHVHRGVAGTEGDVVVPFLPPTSGNPGSASGCVTGSAVMLGAIRSTPTAFYVNVHTRNFPEGAVRGQLF